MKKKLTPNEQAQKLLSHIFTDILPQHGMVLRNNQRDLALEMLAALQGNKIALCEAEVGIGKTHAYILAAIVHKLFSDDKTPTVISTSTIALQKALTEEYIPQISRILLYHGIIGKPLSFIVRKGKEHYVCDNRLHTYHGSVKDNNLPQDAELLERLHFLTMADESGIDLDNIPFTPYVKRRICVSQKCNGSCPHIPICRYAALKECGLTDTYDFQITNHNYVLADVFNHNNERKRLLPPYGIAIFDEAHKLINAAQQMYGSSIASDEITKLAGFVLKYSANDKETSGLCTDMLETNDRLFKELAISMLRPKDLEQSRFEAGMTGRSAAYINQLIACLGVLSRLFQWPGDIKLRQRYRHIRNSCDSLRKTLQTFLEQDERICWLEKTGAGAYELCSLPKELDRLLHLDLWKQLKPYILTSGTMSVGGDFTRFMEQTGIAYETYKQDRIMQTVKPSPFDYKQNALLYISDGMPFPDLHDPVYIDAITEQIKTLIHFTYGHTLVLFTSYWLMERIYNNVKDKIQFPFFMMSRGRLGEIDRYRKSRNGVLFASDSAGEGIDLAGDILSSLIVVKLPFPIPDPISEYERSGYDSFNKFRSAVVTPNMLIKLRQWIGRGIRQETDTAVFSILDSRAGQFGRYRRDVLDALPDMPVTSHIEDAGRFIINRKSEDYFAITGGHDK